jgi:hypothetical protein
VDLQDCFDRAASELGVDGAVARYGRFSELKHVWRENGSRTEFIVSDYMVDAPEDIMQCLAKYLVSRFLLGTVDRESEKRYLSYVRSEGFWNRNRDVYLTRSKNLVLEPRGIHHDLRTVFSYVNSNYFNSTLEAPLLAWTCESPRSRVGYYISALNLLAVNRALDRLDVPRFVLEFVMFHELLHHVDSSTGAPSRRTRHTREFRRQERSFSSFREAEEWLSRIARMHRTKAGGRGVPQV